MKISFIKTGLWYRALQIPTNHDTSDLFCVPERVAIRNFLIGIYPTIEIGAGITDQSQYGYTPLHTVVFRFKHESDEAAFLLWSNGGVEIPCV